MSRALVIGAGHWHLPLYEKGLMRHHEVVGVSDPDPASAGRAGRVFSTSSWTRWQTMLEEVEDVDLAYLLGDHSAMATTAHELIARRIPFVLEKPGAVNLRELRGIEEAAAKAEVPATAALVQRFGPLPSLISELADLRTLSFTFLAGPPSRYADSGNSWVLDRTAAGGGCFALLGVHFADLFISATGAEPEDVAVRGVASRDSFGLPVDDHTSALLRTSDGRTGVIEIGWTFPDSPRKRHVAYAFTGEHEAVTVDSLGRLEFERSGQETVTRQIDVDSDQLYPAYVEAVAGGLATGFEGLPTLTDLRKAMEIVDLVYSDSEGVPAGTSETWLPSG